MFFIQILKKLHFVELFEARDCIIGNNVSNINATIPAVFQNVISKTLLNLEETGFKNTKY